MNRVIKIVAFLISFLLINIFSIEVFSYKDEKQPIKVGYYSYNPYYYKDKNGEVRGYYHDLLKILVDDIGVEFEYVDVDIKDAIEMLKSKKIDILLGVHNVVNRNIDILYTENSITTEFQCVYISDNKVLEGDINYLNGKKYGYVEGDISSNWLIRLLKCKNINVELVECKSIDDCVKMLLNGEVDAISAPKGNTALKDYNPIFRYSLGLVYIAGNLEHKELLDKFDYILSDKYRIAYYARIKYIYDKYFRRDILIFNLIIVALVFLLIAFVIYKWVYPWIKKIIIRGKIKRNKKRFILYYQPIVDLRSNTIAGFEGLLRLEIKDNKVLNPGSFMKYIDMTDMNYDVTLWILEKAMNDYKIISSYEEYKNKSFYISINLSFSELENEMFINKAVKLINNNSYIKENICIEIIENIVINNLDKVKSNIQLLKDNGFKISIDDFGVEYSNLNILEVVEFDNIKLDKCFADRILKSKINNEVIKFISNITLLTNKKLIIEGVEERYQIEEIKKINNKNIYIQGYYYSKPLSLKDLESFRLNRDD